MMGRQTIFPTIEEAQKVLGKVGIKKPREEVSGYQTAGETQYAYDMRGDFNFDFITFLYSTAKTNITTYITI